MEVWDGASPYEYGIRFTLFKIFWFLNQPYAVGVDYLLTQTIPEEYIDVKEERMGWVSSTHYYKKNFFKSSFRQTAKY